MWIKEYLKAGTKQSSMRLTMLWAMVLISIIFVAIAIHIIFATSVEWMGISAVIVSLGGFIVPFLFFKKEQNKIENVRQTQQNQGI